MAFLCIDVAMRDPVHDIDTTVKFLNFWKPENFAVIYLKFKKRGQTFGFICQKDANGKANSGDPEEPRGAV